MKKDVNGYINCQFGYSSGKNGGFTDSNGNGHQCPSGPKMMKPPGLKSRYPGKYSSTREEARKPFFYLHECYRSELGRGSDDLNTASDCKKVREWSINRCIAGGKTKSYCEKYLPPEGSPSLNRENSGNLTSISSWNHSA